MLKVTESTIQKAVAEYLEFLVLQGKILNFSSIPNLNYSQSWGMKMKNKKEGLRAGLPDLFVLHPKGCFFLELKTLKGRLTEVQKAWLEKFKQANVPAYVAHGYEEAIKVIDQAIL